MATYVEVNGNRYEATITGKISDKDWDGRESKTIRTHMSYEEACSTFVDNTEWLIVQHQGVDEDSQEEIFDNSEFCKAGAITDYRDGTVGIKMGKLTPTEILIEFQNMLDLPDEEA